MVLSLLGGQRQTRLILVAFFATTVLFYLAYQYRGPQQWEAFTSDHASSDEAVADNRGAQYNPGTGDTATAVGNAAVEPADGTPGTASDGTANETTNETTEEIADEGDAADPPAIDCVPFVRWMSSKESEPKSEGKRSFPYMRPPPECRTFNLPSLEKLLERMKGVIKDPDLYRLFENSYPITLDTMVKWHGYANKTDNQTQSSLVTDEELTYVITGDIDAMWLRDSASQIYSYLPLLEPSTDPNSLASLWRGVINSHARYINISPYCHSFQPPPESGIQPTYNDAYGRNNPQPGYDRDKVFDCKWELDSLASFLQISSAYYKATGDIKFFAKYNWVSAVAAALKAAGDMRLGTYDKDGKVLPSAWTFTGYTNRGSETLTNDGLGNPIKENGMIRTAFRPSDDACIFQFLTPANMMWAKYLEEGSLIMEQLDVAQAANLSAEMRNQATGIRRGIDLDAIVAHREFGDIFAYEVDGFGSANLMDDANVPSLLAMPLWNYSLPAAPKASFAKSVKAEAGNLTSAATGSNNKRDGDGKGEKNDGAGVDKNHDYDLIYRNTRAFVLSDANPYYAKGPIISAVGGPHLGPGKAWPMAAIVAGLTAYEPASGLEDPQKAVEEQLRMVLDSTTGFGVVHETVNSWSEGQFTRPWFGWANGMFGELILRIEAEEAKRGITGDDSLLARSWQ